MINILRDLIINFHNRELPDFIKRNVKFPESRGSVSVITGMRRTGKTYFCYQKMQELLDTGLPKNRLLYLNFEDDRIFGFSLKDFQSILDVYYECYPENREVCCYFFFDEIQIVPHWEQFIRRLIDTENIQITLTGSSSKMLSSEIATSMRGRSLTSEIFPFSFEEFMEYHKIYKNPPRLGGDKVRAKLKNALNRYFLTGGFPEIQNDSQEIQTARLQDYINIVTLRDILERHEIKYSPVIKHILQTVFYSPGSNFSIKKLVKFLKSEHIPCSRETIQEYLDYFYDSYVFYPVPLYTESLARRRVNPDKVYVIDPGLIRAMSIKHATDNGAMLENMVFIHLRRQGYQLYYIKTEQKNYEIDFYALHPITKKQFLIQVSYDMSNQETLKRETRAICDVADFMKINNKFIVTWEQEDILENNVKVIPAWKFLLNHF